MGSAAQNTITFERSRWGFSFENLDATSGGILILSSKLPLEESTTAHKVSEQEAAGEKSSDQLTVARSYLLFAPP